MPASPALVSLDHAKQWAKRLLKHGPYRQLAQAQEAVAVMLGHASWHALTASYPASPTLSPSAVAAPNPASKPFWEQVLEAANQADPHLKATRLLGMAHDLDLFDSTPAAIAGQMEEEEAPYSLGWDHLETALTQALQNVKPPKDTVFLRLETPEGIVLTTLSKAAMAPTA